MSSTSSNSYLAFLTDIPHLVTKVESGVRVVLQYDLFLETLTDLPSQEEKEEDDDDDDDFEVITVKE